MPWEHHVVQRLAFSAGGVWSLDEIASDMERWVWGDKKRLYPWLLRSELGRVLERREPFRGLAAELLWTMSQPSHAYQAAKKSGSWTESELRWAGRLGAG